MTNVRADVTVRSTTPISHHDLAIPGETYRAVSLRIGDDGCVTIYLGGASDGDGGIIAAADRLIAELNVLHHVRHVDRLADAAGLPA